jgi:hypothetical protein
MTKPSKKQGKESQSTLPDRHEQASLCRKRWPRAHLVEVRSDKAVIYTMRGRTRSRFLVPLRPLPASLAPKCAVVSLLAEDGCPDEAARQAMEAPHPAFPGNADEAGPEGWPRHSRVPLESWLAIHELLGVPVWWGPQQSGRKAALDDPRVKATVEHLKAFVPSPPINCQSCGNQMDEEDVACDSCGEPAPLTTAPFGPQGNERWLMGRASGKDACVTFTRTMAGKEVERTELTLEELVTRVRRRRAAVAILLPEREGQTEPYGIGIATEGEPGYMPWKGLTRMAFRTYAEATKEAKMLNRDIFRLTPYEADMIVASSMRNGVAHP